MTFHSTVWPDVRPATLAGLLRARAAERPEWEAFVFLEDGEEPGERLSYAGLDRRARTIAAALRESLAPGDRALLLYPPGLEFIAAFFGCLYAGVTAVPAYPPRLNDRAQTRLRAIAQDAEPRAALTTAGILAAVAGGGGQGELAAVRWIATDGLEDTEEDGLAEPDPESVAFLQYTSGSTAAPKGVMVTHANLLHNEGMIGEAFRQDEETVVVGWLPLYHDMGLIGNVLQPLHAGARCVLMSPLAFLQRPVRWLRAIDRFRGTTSGGPNFAYDLCVRRVSAEQRAGLDLSSWRVAFNGAEPVRAETLERFAEAFAPCGFDRGAFYPCYGLAEATLFVTGGTAGRFPRVAALDAAALERHEARRVSECAEGEDAGARLLVSCGRPWGGQRLVIADPESGSELPSGKVGEIWIAGPSVARGYWRNPEATERDFGARLAGPTGPMGKTADGPFLRTGDLGFVRDGELYVTGRLKDLIILRGRNHYPQDVERTAERSHPDLRPGGGAAFSVDVEGEERLVVVQEVERHAKDDLGVVAAAVRRAVAEEHEAQVQDVVLVRASTVPKTSSGKVQRRACRALYLAGELAVVGRSALPVEAPEPVLEGADLDLDLNLDRAALLALAPAARQTALESLLRSRAAAAVGVPASGIDPGQPLTALGLDSLGAMELKAGVEAAVGVPVPLAELLEGAGTAELAALLLPLLEPGEASSLPDPSARPSLQDDMREDDGLSWGQRALWFLHRLAPEGGAYNIAVAARARGLDGEALKRALAGVAARHEALRAGLAAAAEDAAGWSEARVAARLAAEAYRPFDLENGPLLRLLVLDRGDGERVLLLAVHHIAADFASLAVIARELSALYGEETGGPAAVLPEPVPYSVFVRWQRATLAAQGEALWEYWRTALAGVPDLDLPADRPRPPLQTWNGGARTLELPADLAERLRALGARHGATLFMTLLAAFQAQLGRYAGQDDLAVGTPNAGRSAPGLAGIVGYLVNPVALRADLGGDPAFSELLERTRRTALAGLEHGDFPFALLAERLRPVRDPSRPPLFQVMFLLQRGRPGDPPGLATFALGEAGGRLRLGDVEIESLRLEERRAQLDLTLRAAEEEGRLRLSLEHNTDLFDGATAERMLGHFRTLLEGAAADPAPPVSRLPLLAPGEREQVLVGWNATAAGHRRDLLLHQPFEAQAARTPEAEALVTGTGSASMGSTSMGSASMGSTERLTYGELSWRANQLARHLQKLGVGPEVRVAVRMERSADLVVSLLAVLKAGGAYVPLDPRYPRQRLDLMLADSGARVVLGDLADHREAFEREDGSDLPPAALPGNLAYLIYTSGSTGRPKAVAIEHRSAAVLVQWAGRAFSPQELAGVLAATSVGFDLSVFELFVPLSWGGRVILAENALELPRHPAAGEVTLVNTVPSAMAELVRAGGLPPSLRTVNLAGEPVPQALVDAVYRVPGVERFYNLYGPSEDTTYSTWALLAPGVPVSIGGPVDDTVAYVVDAFGEPVPVGVPGELWLGGAGLARGYLGRPGLTAERFVPDSFAGLRGLRGERLYRTGDLVRRRPDGALDFLGRIDHQVKIRGFRIELGEVEAALAAHPEVRAAAVLALPERGLAAYVVPRESAVLEPAALRAFLQARLPEAFVPSAWAVLAELPLSPNGKVDRKALAHVGVASSGDRQRADGAPRGPVEEAVAGLFAEALGVPRVGPHDDFFGLGGHSLLATRVLSRVSRLFAVDLPVSVLFQAPTPAALAARISREAGGAAAAPPIVPVLHPHEAQADGLPLSFAQQRLWFLDQLQPGGAAYNMPGAVLLTGALDVPALAAALSEAVRRHETLRTRFASRGGRPVQIVEPPAPAALPVVDLGGLPEAAREAEARALAAAEAARPFDLREGRLLRVTLLRLAPESHLELVTLHHIVGDGWSLGVLLEEMFPHPLSPSPTTPAPPPWERGNVTEPIVPDASQTLRSRPPSPGEGGGSGGRGGQGVRVQYADFALWQRGWLSGGALAAQLSWWRRQLEGAPTTLELPADRPRPATRTPRGVRVHTALPGELTGDLRELARREGGTLFMALLAGFEALLVRLTGQGDLLLGSVVANRTRPEIEGLIGLFANTLVLRARLDDDPPFLEGLARARQTALGAWAHQDLPLEVLVEELHPEREAGRTPLFQVVLAMQGPPLALDRPGLSLRRVPVDSGAAKLDLTVEITEGADGGLEMVWELSRDLFDPGTGKRMAGWLEILLRGVAMEPGRRLSELPLLGAAERRQLLVAGTANRVPAPIPSAPVHRLFEEQAARAPQRVALVAETEREVTYGELNARANRLARWLIASGVAPETRVGVAVERSPAMIESFLAVLKAGGAYVPLDPSHPPERLAALAEEAGVELLLDAGGLAAAARAIAAQRADDLRGPGLHLDPGALAYVMFTSGSTGRPKAVAVEHRGIVRLVRGTDSVRFGPDEVFLQLAPPAFDASTFEIWGALLHGARLVLAPAGPPSLDGLGELLERHGVTTLWLTAGLFHQAVESRIGILRGVRQLLAGGDVLAPEAVNRVLAELPGFRIDGRMINGYGPTENTTFTCCHTVREAVPPGGSVPVGRPIPGTRVHLLDRWLQPVPAGAPGELWTGGEGLARGYLGRPDLTAERFLPDPFAGETGAPGGRLYRTGDLARWRPDGGSDEGTIELIGRIDRQVKIRGFRVEPGEVEAVLGGHPAVAQAAVLVRGEGPADRRLVACVVPRDPGAGLDPSGVRAWLAGRLPPYLVPALAVLPELPLTANGKVDRAALARLAPEPERGGGAAGGALGGQAPRNPLEELLAGIWADVLRIHGGVEQVGIHDDFFALGGHSLLATRAVSRIVDALGVDLPLSSFFEAPTVAGLAERLRQARGTSPAPPVSRVARDGPLPLSFAQQRLWLLGRMAPGGTAYNLAVAARLSGALDAAALERSLTEIVRRHEALRTVFAESGGRPVQIVRPPSPVSLARLDLSGLPAAERWGQALAAARREAARPFDLAAGPVVRFLLSGLGAGDHLLGATFHHIAADGWSLQVFLRELAALYGAFAAGRPSPLPELPVQYGDFAVWQRRLLSGAALARPLAFWRWRLEGAETLDLPADRPRGAAGDAAPVTAVRLHLPAPLAAALASWARESGATPFMVFLAGLFGLLSRLTGQADLTVGAPVAGRDRREIEGLIGFFANTLPLRADVSGDPGLRGLLPRVRSLVLEAHGHAEVPFERVVEELHPERVPGRNPLFDVLLSWMSAPAAGPEIPGLGLTPVDLPGAAAKLDLAVTVHERGGALAGVLEGRADLYEEATLVRFAGQLARLVAGALEEPGRPLSAVPLLAAEEEHQVRFAWSRTEPAVELADGDVFHRRFAAQARRTPGAVALAEMAAEGGGLTYGELEARANRLAHCLVEIGVRRGQVVALLLERSPEAVAALLAVLKSGAAYLPLDPGHPRERLAAMLEDSGAVVAVDSSFLEREADRIARQPAEAPAVEAGLEDLAYVIYTSGSTGRPKGVAVSHRAVVSFAAAMRRAVPELREEGPLRLSLNAPLVFDASVQQLVHLLYGHALWIVPEEARRDAGRLADFLRASGIDGFDCTPSQLAVLLAAIERAGRGPRFVVSGGEAISAELWQRLAAHPTVRFYNVYGPTEATVNATAGPVSGEMPSLGRPLAGYRVLLLDAGLLPVPPGARGEVWIGGPGLARGYHGRPDLSAERFRPDPWAEEPGARLYRTGDLGRWQADGRIEYHGRADQQVKVRGHRVEPGEIEACLRLHPAVVDAAVVAGRDPAGGVRLAAHFVSVPSTQPVEAAELRDHLRRSLPESMIPAAFQRHDALPVTAGGKLDRKALARLAPRALGALGEGEATPGTPVQELLAGLWRELLGAERIGPADSFFDLGGHSLLAAQLAARVRAVFEVEVALSELFAAPALAGMAERIEAARRLEGVDGEAAPPLARRADPAADAPLSFAQQRLWFLHQLEPESPAYHVPGALRITGPLVPGRLAAALDRVVQRHEALRTVFLETEAGPVQRVLPKERARRDEPGPVPMPLVDLRALPAPEAEAERLGLEAARRTFDLARGPLLRALLLRTGEEEHRLAVVMHHIVSDGWSLGVMTGELAALYAGQPLPALALQVADFAAWQRGWLRGRVLERQLAWWRTQLAEPPLLDLPGDRSRPPQPSGRGAGRPVVLPADLSRAVKALARGEGATLFMTLLGAFAVLLQRYSGQDDLTVGSPIANRDHWEIEPLIGCFVNTLPLRVRLTGEPSFRALLGRVRDTTLGAYDHQGVPFEKLVEDLAPERDRAHTPLFQVMLAFQNTPTAGPAGFGGLSVERSELPTGTSKFDLTLALMEAGEEIAGTLEHSTDLFLPATAERLVLHLAELLRGAAADPDRRISGLPLLTAAEQEEILAAWSGTAAGWPRDLLLSDLVAAQAARTPEAVAVVGWKEGREERLTYAGLLARADRLAADLAARGAGPEVRVGVCLERTPDLIVALLGVLRAGAAYVPLDPAYPRERLDFMRRDSGAEIVIGENPSSEPGSVGPARSFGLCEQPAASPGPRSQDRALPGNLAYLIYTSGSTGTPKAVAIEHRSAVAMVSWALRAFDPEELAGVLFATSVCFDLSVFEIFAPLAAGGRIVVAANALELPDLPAAGEVTLVNTVPSAMAELARREGFPTSVRTVNLAGEPLKGALVDAAYALPGVRRVVNLYGPSEDTTYSTFAVIPGPERQGEPGIGRPIADTRVYLLDRWGNPVPEGVPGELLLGGAGLARGYLGRPELTAERFVPDPFAVPGEGGARLYRTGDLARWRPGGQLEYLGRIDQQVKVRGFRIELGEIEAALARHPAVAEAAVLVREDELRGRLLAAFLVVDPEAGEPLGTPELRRFLRQSLPEHMVPSLFTELAALPLTPNGKVDRRTLARLRLEGAVGRAAAGARTTQRTPTEELLAALWCEVLGRDQVGLHDSFFDLGGHSLLATRLVSRVRATFGSELPLARLFDAPTVAELARVLDEARSAGAAVRTAPIRPLPPEARSGDLPLSFAQERLWFLDRLQTGSAVYNVPLAVRLRGRLDAPDVARLAAAFGAIVARHEALRTVFPERDGDPVQRVLPPADPAAWSLPVADLTALPRPAAGREARELAVRDSLLPFSLETGPLLRTRLLALGREENLLLLNMHHIVSDGWSLGVLLGDLAALVRRGDGQEGELPELPVQYADFAVWQREWLQGRELQRQIAYWRRELEGAPAVLELPADRPRPLQQTWRGAHLPVEIPAPLNARLTALGRRQGVTPFMLLLAAWSVLLHRHCGAGGRGEVNVGSPIAGRNRSETERLIGFFVNTLVLRSDLADDPPFPELLARTRRTALAAYDHQDLPFEKLVDELKPERTMSHQPLFQVMFALQNAPLGALELPGLTLEPLDLGAVIAKFDLTLSLMERESGAIGGFLEFNTDLYDTATALRLRSHLEVLLEEIAGDAARPVSELPILSAGERQQLVVEWSDGSPEPLGPCLHELFEEVAERHAGVPAVVDGRVAWSYGELNRRANRLAWRLRASGVGPEARVALCVERSAEMLVGMLGVLKAGGAYVPVDPAYPRERLAFMLADTGAPVLLTQERLRGLLPPVARIICLDGEDEEETARQPAHNPPRAALGSSPAYIIYTSGSTGTPKGVVTPHDAVVAYSQASSALYGTRPGDRDLQFSSISFDASVEEIYGCLTRGATLYVRGEAQEGASELLDRCREQEITLLQFPTAFWHQLATAMEAEELPLPRSVRTLFVGGEKMLASRLIAWCRLVPPGVRVFNAYGPTETTVAAVVCPFPGPVPVDESLREVPLGRPLPFVRAYVLDRGMRPVPLGVTGELFLGGLGLARGYLDRPALTAERFVPNPYAGLWGSPGERLYRTGDLVKLLPGGLLEFVGRADGQVKIRGYRIEPGEIEETLAGHPNVAQAVVLTREDVPGEARLVAFIAAKAEPAPAAAELREFLAARLPSYMVPSALQVLPSLPVSAHGKVDRRALARRVSVGPADLSRGRPAWAAPQNELEEKIAAVWRDLFRLAEPGAVGVDDNFFDSGGSSLLLVKMHSRLQKALGRSFPLVEIFKHPTIRTLAASLGAPEPAKPSLDKARARTDARRESMRQLQQLRDQRRRRP